uniref:Putative secreted protein n=1 Tax=Anopheles triannulatus TaxID=58253 RepID=A0A2M4B6G6_9DIPT
MKMMMCVPLYWARAFEMCVWLPLLLPNIAITFSHKLRNGSCPPCPFNSYFRWCHCWWSVVDITFGHTRHTHYASQTTQKINRVVIHKLE